MKTKPRAVFLGKNGYPGQAEEACKVLTPGKRYTITGCSIGQSHSSVTVKGRSYNSVMFGISVDRLMKYFGNPYACFRGLKRVEPSVNGAAR